MLQVWIFVAWGASAAEATLADIFYFAFVGGGASFAGAPGAAVGFETALGADYLISTASPLAIPENYLGIGSLGFTGLSDALAGNHDIDLRDGTIAIGKNTVVSAGHMVAGFAPEANFDLAVSTSQLAYDMGKHPFIESGGSISIPIPDISLKKLLR